MRDDHVRGDWGDVDLAPSDVMRITSSSTALGNQGVTDANTTGTEISIVVEGEPLTGTLSRAVLHFVRDDVRHAPRMDPDGTLRCWFDRHGLDIALHQLRYPGVTLSYAQSPQGPDIAILRTPRTRISVR